ncbi:hypothetical protein AHF37_04426 [Paragonimus kellicotti]|nr:hypothetical protein AHF37_04426 [Paragonimus kellicotti]
MILCYRMSCILAWSDQPIVQVAVFIDNQYLGNATTSRALRDEPNHLFALSWNASQWADRLQHQLKVLVVDSSGRRRIQIHFVLQTDHTFNFRLIFYLYELLICGALVIFKLIQARWTRPIFMGFLIGYHFGIVFSFGIFVAGTFVMEALTYVYQIVQVISFTFLYLLYVIWYCGRHQTQCSDRLHLSMTVRLHFLRIVYSLSQ